MKYTVKYTHNYKNFGFENTITVTANSEAEALKLAQNRVLIDICHDNKKNFKRFTFKLL